MSEKIWFAQGTRKKEQGCLGMVVGSIDMPWHWFIKPDFEFNIFRKKERVCRKAVTIAFHFCWSNGICRFLSLLIFPVSKYTTPAHLWPRWLNMQIMHSRAGDLWWLPLCSHLSPGGMSVSQYLPPVLVTRCHQRCRGDSLTIWPMGVSSSVSVNPL